MKNFVLIGAAGYVAPKHMKAIKDVGGTLVAALDPHDSVGILDSYFPECAFFTEFERFDRFCSIHKIDYVSICSPNYLHDADARLAMRIGADAICEKPVTLTERNLDGLLNVERLTGKRVWNVLQCRYHPAVSTVDLPTPQGRKVDIEIEYVTPRGNWYDYSWKSNVKKSGGLATNVGVHLFDLVTHLYGECEEVIVDTRCDRYMEGRLELISAHVSWKLSIEMGSTPKRVFRIEGRDYDLTNGFTDLHTKVYREILDGNGIGLEEARESIRICESIRNNKL